MVERYIKTVEEIKTEGCRIPPEGLGYKIIHLPPGLQGIHSRHYRLDPGKPNVQERTPTRILADFLV
jgi:hypothetical protein